MTTLTAGIHYDIPESVYHADPCPAPSLSNSIATILLGRSPLHAWHAHPRLNPEREEDRETTAAMDFGSALHKLLLGRGSEIAVIEADDYRKQAAKDARDEARGDGRIPLLSSAYDRAQAAASASLRQMHEHPDCQDFFAPGHSEVALVWQEGDVWARGLVDRLPDDPTAPAFDLKATDLSAAPEAWDRRMVSAYRTQDPFYRRGLRALRGVMPPPTRFVVIESKAPFAISVLCPAPSLQSVGEADVERAFQIWARCIKTNTWPSYPAFTAHVEAPNWLLSAADERAMRDEIMEELT